ncbi:MAG TPA: Crp/Fnr family transcriptional regulator [Steroidobacteraceae bacterium]|nr:Crp/Fnr family transcriptional regulator [Steroidobacteraceae bacterium]
MTSSAPATKNRLLELLPRADRQRLLAECEQVELRFGDVLREPEWPIRHVYFPTSCCISLVAPIDSGGSLEVAVIGEEGALGISVAFGIHTGAQRALVKAGGTAWRIAAAPFCREFKRSPRLRRLLSRYLYVVMAQLSQTAVCTNFHDVAARLSRWLLMTGDRAQSDRFHITQEYMSAMLGVRREGVNRAATLLQKRKLIRYVRGNLTILDRRALQSAACGCYSAARSAYLLQYPGVTRR